MNHQIVIPLVPSSGNQQRRRHWAVNRREKQQIEAELWAAARSIPKAEGKRRTVRVLFVKPPRGKLDDPSNLAERTKPLLDAMVALNLIEDDSAVWIDWRGCSDERAADGPRTVVDLEDVA